MKKMISKYGEWALVTGGCSGIGKAFVKKLLEEGFNCIVISNKKSSLVELKESLSGFHPKQRIEIYVLDLENINELEERLKDPLFRLVKVVVNCAGFGYIGAATNKLIGFHLRLIKVNAIAPFYISHHYAKLFYKKSTKGAIINVSSANAELVYPIPFSSVYTPSKIFVKYFTESMAYEMSSVGIDMINVSCGPTNTNFQSSANTNRLFWSEKPEKVVNKTLRKLGKRKSLVTNPISSMLIHILRYLPMPRNLKVKLLIFYFGRLLGGNRETNLE